MTPRADLDPIWRYGNRRTALAAAGALALSACGPGEQAPAPIAPPQKNSSPASPAAPSLKESTPTVEPRFREVAVGKSILLHAKDIASVPGQMHIPVSYWTPERTFVRNSTGQVQQINEKTGKDDWTWPDKKGQVLAANDEFLALFDEETSRTYIIDSKTKQQKGFISPERLSAQALKARYRFPAYILGDKLVIPRFQTPGGIPFGYGMYSNQDAKELNSSTNNENVWIQDLVGNSLIYLNITNEGWFINLYNLKTGSPIGTSILVARRAAGSTDQPLLTYNSDRILSWADGTLQLTDIASGQTIARFGANFIPTKMYAPVKSGSGQEFSFYQSGNDFMAYPTDTNSQAFERANAKPLFSPQSSWLFEQTGTGILKAYGKDYGQNAPPTWENPEVQAAKFHGTSGGRLIFTNWDEEAGAKPQSGNFTIYFVDPAGGKAIKQGVVVDSSKDLPKVVLGDKATYIISKTIEKYDPQAGKGTEVVFRNEQPAKYAFNTGRGQVHVEFPNKFVSFKL